MLRTTKSVFVSWLALALTVASVATAAAAATDGALFPRPPSIARRVAFWKRIFTEFREDQAVFHDSQHVHLVYSVIDLPSTSQRRSDALRAAEKDRIRAILLRLHRHGDDPSALNAEERTIFDLFVNISEHNKFLAAADRVRSQIGLRDRFARGLGVSHGYASEMEHIFRAAGLPAELIWLPMIESCFDIRAYSHKGAAGIWQFMPTTGRLYGLRVDRLVDERRDVIRATRAAARYLAANYGELGHWPLAITAYNHGSGGIARGVRSVGSENIADLVERYQGRTFGFAGQNFYAEFLAAVDIARDPHAYFPNLRFEEPVPSDEFILPDAVGLTVAARAAGISSSELAALNPSLSSHVLRGSAHIPRGYRLRIPPGGGADLQRQVAGWTAERETRLARADRHRVRPGETLSDIATRYGTTVTALLRDNGIRNPRLLRTGQTIKIARRDGGGSPVTAERATQDTPQTEAPQTVATSGDGSGRHRVRSGQTLTDIAQHYGTTVPALTRENGIRNARSLRAGQVLKVPGPARAAAPAPAPDATPALAAATPEHPEEATPEVAAADATAAPSAAAPAAPQDPVLAAAQPTDAAPAAVRESGPRRHQVRRGQTLTDIARQYGTTVPALKRQNGIRNARSLRAGQVLTVPGPARTAAPAPDATPALATATPEHPEEATPEHPEEATPEVAAADATVAPSAAAPAAPQDPVLAAAQPTDAAPAAARESGPRRHHVRRGQTLTDIARQYGTTVPALKRENGIRNARSLRAGQVLTVPGLTGTAAPAAAPDATPALAAATPDHPAGATPEVAAADATLAPSAAAPQEPSATAEPADAAPEAPRADDAAELTAAAPPAPNDALIAPEQALDAALATAESEAAEPAEAGPDSMAAVASAPDAQQQHRVRPGETLTDIAKAYGTTVPALLEHNGIRDARDLRAGQALEIPAATGSNSVLAALRSDAGYFHHRVRRGQTLSDIAKQYGTSVSTLQRYNGIRDARRLQARQVIRIPTS